MSNPSELVAVPASMAGVAGVVTWWSLSGAVDCADLEDAWLLEGMDKAALPPPPSKDAALWRAAQAALPAKGRYLLRPLKQRGTWEVVSERVVGQGVAERLEFKSEMAGRVVRDNGSESVLLQPEGHELAAKVRANLTVFEHTLMPNDISSWLCDCAMHLCAGVSLRDRGGFYFIPRSHVEKWKSVVRAAESASSHKVFQMPAMESDEAVAAVLAALRREAEEAMSRMESYLAGEVSTRGLNSSGRTVEEVRGKLAHYATLLGVALPDLDSRLQTLTGAIQAARVVEKAPTP